MGQIVKRKKKGRPSKADLVSRRCSGTLAGQGQAEEQVDHRRRSMRRRNVRYNNFIDFDDFLDEFEDFEEIVKREVEEEEDEEPEAEDEEEEEEERDEIGRKEKKLKLVLKLQNEKHKKSRNNKARGPHARENSHVRENGVVSEEDDDDEGKPLKKRKINGGDDDASEGEDDSENDDDDDDSNNNNNDNKEERERKADANHNNDKGLDSVPGTPVEHPNVLPLPDKKILELILDKLQKKDTYNVYAEPVDLEELPDYLDVIDHPMDFATVRKKLGNGSYSTLEQFESDLFLICSNAMRYNAPETIYHKQARAIQELARKKFQKLRIDIERTEKELKSEQKTKSNVLVKKQMKKPLNRAVHEPVGSDFSSGATLATAGDVQNGSVPTPAGASERPSNTDGLVEGNSSLVDNNLEKTEELSSGKDVLSKFGRKSSGLDENRRATYNTSNQPVVRSESIFTTFEGEIKQLVAVGLHAEYSYARSLARFAATLGPVAWKVASERIEQSLPNGCKFGRGWVGEYEPLPTPVLMLEQHTLKESIFFSKLQCTADGQKGDLISRNPVPAKGHSVRGPTSGPSDSARECTARGPTSERTPVLPREQPIRGPTLEGPPVPTRGRPIRGAASERTSVPAREHPIREPISEEKPLLFRPTSGPVSEGTLVTSREHLVRGPTSEGTLVPARELPIRGPISEEKPSLFGPTSGPTLERKPSLSSSAGTKHSTSVNPTYQQQNPPPKNFAETRNKASKQVELNLPPSSYQHDADIVAEKQLPKNCEMAASKPREMTRTMGLVQSIPSKQADKGVGLGGLPNGKISSSSFNSRMVGSSSDSVPTYFPRGQEHGLTDPVEAMRISAEKAQKQQKPSNQSSTESSLAMPSGTSVRNDNNNAAAVAARAWMSLGATGFKTPAENPTSPKNQISVESLYNPARQLHPQIPLMPGQFPLAAAVQFQSEKNSFPFQAIMRPALLAGNEGQFQNRPMMFPQFIATDLSRFQMQSQAPWRGLNPNFQPKHKQETLPPDLNIGFQSPGSPVKPSSGVMVDSQQPDLALQL